jgi:hypothetical protein
MKKRTLFIIIIISLLLLLLLICYNNEYEYFTEEDINNRCYGGLQDGATCELNVDNCYNFNCPKDTGCEPICKGINDDYLCFKKESRTNPIEGGEDIEEEVPILEIESDVKERFDCENNPDQEICNNEELLKQNIEQLKCNTNILENRKCPGGMCIKCSDKISELDGKCGLYNNGCGYPCVNDTVLDRSSNGSTQTIENWLNEKCSDNLINTCENDGCIWNEIEEKCEEPEKGRLKFNIIDSLEGVPTQDGCCSKIKKCGIGKPGSETDPCYPNGYCIKCSYDKLSWNPELIINRKTNSVINNNENCNILIDEINCNTNENCNWIDDKCENNNEYIDEYEFTIENTRMNDVLFLIPYNVTINEDDNEVFIVYEDNIKKFPPLNNDNKTSLNISINPDYKTTSGYIIQLIRVDKFIDGISNSKLPYKNDKSLLNNDISNTLYLENVDLAGVKEYNIPNNMINSDINSLIGNIIKEQNIYTRICSDKFGGITENNEPSENFQCICNDGYITNNNIDDWMPPIGAPIVSLSENPTKEELNELNTIFNPFYEIKDDDTSIRDTIITQMRNINDWENRNRCRVIDESVQQQGSTISRLSQDYEEIDELWNNGEWNPQQKAGGKHISDSNYIKPPSL